MAKFKSMLMLLVVSAFVSGVLLTGCGGGISEEQWNELQTLKAKVSQLEADKAAKENEKKRVQNAINEKDSKLKTLQADIQKLKDCK
jgi:outer membrane murein-binding lipoprotein Lpp